MILSVKSVQNRSTAPAFRNYPAQCSGLRVSEVCVFGTQKCKKLPKLIKRRKTFRIRGAVLRCGADIDLDISAQGLILRIISTKDDYFSRFEDRKPGALLRPRSEHCAG